MKRKMRVYMALGAVVIAMGFLIVSGFNTETMVYSIKVQELKARGESAFDKGYRIEGFVNPETIKKSSDLLTVDFVVHDESGSLPVVYNGILPDTFKPSSFSNDIEVLLEGKYRQDGSFQATKIMTKCASKYDPIEEGRKERAYDAKT